MQEHAEKPLRKIAFAFLGDAGNNVGESLLIGGAKMGMDVRLGGPKACWPKKPVIDEALAIAKETGARITVTKDPDEAVKGADFLYTDVWLSMGEDKAKWAERIKLLTPWRIDAAMMARTGNPRARFMHCLPAFHNTETAVGREIAEKFGLTEMEVSDEVFESPASVVFDQAENRLHAQKAIMALIMS